MRVGYIKKEMAPYGLIDKIKYFLGIITIEQFEEGTVLKIPFFEKEKKMDKVIQKLLKQIKKLKITHVVFSNEIAESDVYLKIEQEVYQNSINIFDGRLLMNYMNYNILEYIMNLQKTDMKQEDVYFLIKKEPTLNLQFLSKFIEKCKTVNIVTNDVDRFKKIQESLYEKENILIGVSNNKMKSLKRARYILNINFEQKDIEKFKINRNAIIVNFKNTITYKRNTFDGINVSYFKINLPDEYMEKFEKINDLEEFDNEKIYESILIKRIKTEQKNNILLTKKELEESKDIVSKIIEKDGVKIVSLIGKNGKISEEEIIRNYENVIRK